MIAAALPCLSSCSDNEPGPDPDPDPSIDKEYHFDIWVALDRHGGMGRDVQTLVRSLASLDADQPTITFEGTGTEVNSILSLETIVKGKYYYQVPVSGDRFAKYLINNNSVVPVAERQFKSNTYTTRKYTHAWIDDNTLIIMAADGEATKIVWTKLNASDMTIIAEGTLDLPIPQGAASFTTSGILTYRAADNNLFYFYYGKTAGGRSKRVTPVMTAVINPTTMDVKQNTTCFLDCDMVGSAYGELLQTTTIIDDNNNIYLACFTEAADGTETSHLLKIPAGQTSFDPAYDGFTAGGKLISVMYLGGNNVMAYARRDEIGAGIDDFSHYYTILNLSSCTATPVSFEGKQLPFSSGRFSSRMAYVDNKAYIGVDPEGSNPQIFIYDTTTGKVTKGAEMAPGYYFEQIRVVDSAD